MDFAFSEKQEALRTAARRYLAERFPANRVAALADSTAGWDPVSWSELSTLGWFDGELGPLERAVLAEETGYVLYPGPVWTSIALAWPAAAGRLTPDRSAPRPATLAWLDDRVSGLTDADRSSCVVEQTTDGWRASGVKRGVPEAGCAEDAVVVAEGPDGVGLWRLDLSAHRDAVHPSSTVDPTRRMSELWLDGTPVDPLVPAVDTPRTLARVRRGAHALLACESVGVTQRALDIASTHTKPRPQPLRPSGAYPGVSHRIANMYTALQLSRSLAYRAAWCTGQPDGVADDAGATAIVSAGHVAMFACENAIEAVGGLGCTMDHPLHRLYKRAQWINTFEGFPGARRPEPVEARADH